MKKKLIEVALPLEAISDASSREKAIHRGHPTGLHLWWARRPLAACRAVLFSQLVDDPSADPVRFPTEEDQARERQRLFQLIEQLVLWDNLDNDAVWAAAKAEIARSADGDPPVVVDPFCGGGSIPVEAQRLGLETCASDLNPVAVLVTKGLTEIPARFHGTDAVSRSSDRLITDHGDNPLAADVDHYARILERRLREELGDVYGNVAGDTSHGAVRGLTPIAWIWARTMVCPNPVCRAETPLVNSWILCSKPNRRTWVEPRVDPDSRHIAFEIRSQTGAPRSGTVGRNGAECVVCGSKIPLSDVRSQAQNQGLGQMVLAAVAEGDRGRIYLAPDQPPPEVDAPDGILDSPLPEAALGFRVQGYGIRRHRELFTPRQLVLLNRAADSSAKFAMRWCAMQSRRACRKMSSPSRWAGMAHRPMATQ